jgi:predicted membrane-bound spermidine synthase
MPRNKFILEITVFVCGALVMIYEITGSRLLSPYLGASVYIWTSLIGVILAALSLGYWLGGRIADRKPDIKILAFVIFLAGGLVSVTILLKDLILAIIAESSAILEIKSVIAALLLFAPASVLLGFVTPFAVKLKMSSLADTGKTVGRLYALSTVGSILAPKNCKTNFSPSSTANAPRPTTRRGLPLLMKQPKKKRLVHQAAANHF